MPGEGDEAIKVVLMHGEPIVLGGLRQELDDLADIAIVAEVANVEEMFQVIESASTHVVVMDVVLPSEQVADVISEILTESEPPYILLFGAALEAEELRRLFRAGANGYLLRQEDLALLPLAIRSVAAGAVWISPQLAWLLREHPAETVTNDVLDVELSEAEQPVLKLLAQGKTNREIADALCVAQSTARFHLKNIYAKLGAKTRGETIVWAVKHGFGSTT